MTNQQQIEELRQIILKWCPKGFEHEDPFQWVTRGLLNANACVLDLLRIKDGKQPIRPLSSYPIPTL